MVETAFWEPHAESWPYRRHRRRKSVVGEMFVALGAHLVQADRIAHSLMQPGEPVYNEVVRHFGARDSESRRQREPRQAGRGRVRPGDRDQGKRASRIEELNRIVHPAVIRSQDEWMQAIGAQDPHAVAIVEAALILEARRGRALRPADRRDLQGGAARGPLRRPAEDRPGGRAQGSRCAAWPRNFPTKRKSKPPTT